MAFALPEPAPTFKFFHIPAYKPAPAHIPAPAHHAPVSAYKPAPAPAPAYNPAPIPAPAPAYKSAPAPAYKPTTAPAHKPTPATTPAQQLILIKKLKKADKLCREYPLEALPELSRNQFKITCAKLRVEMRKYFIKKTLDIGSIIGSIYFGQK